VLLWTSKKVTSQPLGGQSTDSSKATLSNPEVHWKVSKKTTVNRGIYRFYKGIGGPPFGQSGAVAPPKKYEMLEIWTKFVQKDDFLQ
jgi:hypothetical protein